jgi:hypothetical protein
MTTEKARKRAVRTRMAKTGERYAAARRHVVADEGPATPTAPPALPPRVADPGMTEAAITTGTGAGWDHWFRLLDGWGGAEHSHTDIARFIRDEQGVSGWWAQAVTVGYERARGLRAMHQTKRGFEVSVSKTVAAPPADVWRAFLEPERRRRWIEAGALGRRRTTGSIGRSTSFAGPGDRSRIAVAIDPRGEDRATVTVTHQGLADAEDVATRRAAWRDRLDRLAALYAKPPAPKRPPATRTRRSVP